MISLLATKQLFIRINRISIDRWVFVEDTDNIKGSVGRFMQLHN